PGRRQETASTVLARTPPAGRASGGPNQSRQTVSVVNTVWDGRRKREKTREKKRRKCAVPRPSALAVIVSIGCIRSWRRSARREGPDMPQKILCRDAANTRDAREGALQSPQS